MRLEQIILKTLMTRESYLRKVVPYLKAEYFHESSDKKLFETISKYIEKYNNTPIPEAIAIVLEKEMDMDGKQFENCMKFLDGISDIDDKDDEWLIDQTETFCQDKAVHNAMMAGIEILNGQNQDHDKGAIPGLLQEALGVSFDANVGHDYIENAEDRVDYYHRKEEKIEFDIDMLNEVTDNGVGRKTLSVFIAGTNVGKSLAMCHFAAANLMAGYNVLYITLEMSEEKIGKRLDANLFDIPIKEFTDIDKKVYMTKVDQLKAKAHGKLVIKEYPTASANVNHFRHFINELRLKKNFIPDIIYIDYINICSSSRFKGSARSDMYSYVKSIAEELRGLGVEQKVSIVSATQLNREGFGSSDPDMDDTAESFGLPATADLMIAIVTTPELYEMNQLMFKQLKNRDADVNENRKFYVGIDRKKMRLYNIDQESDGEDKPVMDNTGYGQRMSEDDNKFSRRFDEFK